MKYTFDLYTTNKATMKKTMFIFFSLLFSLSVMGQKDNKVSEDQNKSYVPFIKYNGDTLAYLLHNFYHNKEKYIGKDLNTLLRDLEIPITSYGSGYPDAQWGLGTYSVLYLNSSPQKKPLIIIINWTQTLKYDSVNALLYKSKGKWKDDFREYYGKQIIEDIHPFRSRF